MYNTYIFLTNAHSGWQYLASLALAVAVVVYLVNWLRGQTWSRLVQRIGHTPSLSWISSCCSA